MFSSDLEDAVMRYGAELLPLLGALPADQLQLLLGEVNTINQSHPLRLMTSSRFEIASWDTENTLNGIQVIALYVFGLWVQAGECTERAAFLVEKWPQLPQITAQTPMTNG